ncbi:DUF1343 domain-containing protein [Mucilaginibacter sp. HMF5004]|uniref:exo-beta-N-acetylmuramidase NamZ family protein n=1 Tax=Mucilaginibacter rivuli TaxID=2857527 RepID=UPI001C5FFBA5|nr:DUF1343 domain-containing protein [Mucilaginibacter rivuli]MBW4891447.1 DUF1343 domain-containing protein [Mucilaginibacter rivuli]
MKKLIKNAIGALLVLVAITTGYAQRALPKIITGANRTDTYLPYLKGKNVGMVINQTSIIGSNKTPSVDTLLQLGVAIKKIFGPEHGIRGNAADGAEINNAIDAKTGIPAISLYGKHFKPTPADLAGLDILIFDIQDVGARFYTYISTLHYVMEACAENNIELMVLDRPNPNGGYVDGPVLLDTALRSFVGMHPVPIVHGMTIAEYAQMINGQGWLKNGIKCKLRIIKMLNYFRELQFALPVNPSPNLQTQQAVVLYPSLCLFEGTNVSVGRGTPFPFMVFGSPLLKDKYRFEFTPQPIAGVSDNPPLKGQLCYGTDLRYYRPTAGKLNLSWLMAAYKAYPDKAHFFIPYFTKLAGTTQLQKQIENGDSEETIRLSWEPALSQFKLMRQKYLLYK